MLSASAVADGHQLTKSCPEGHPFHAHILLFLRIDPVVSPLCPQPAHGSPLPIQSSLRHSAGCPRP